jgi:hypothetical protein
MFFSQTITITLTNEIIKELSTVSLKSFLLIINFIPTKLIFYGECNERISNLNIFIFFVLQVGDF